jgi:hypothetical protein
MMPKHFAPGHAAPLFVVAAFTMLLARVSPGAAITSSVSDFEPRLRTGGTITPEGPYDPGPSVNATSLRVGFQTNFLITSAFFFQLPLLAPGESIVGADFSVTELPDSATSAVTPAHNADLVAIGFTNTDPPERTAATSEQSFYLGEGNLDTAPGRLQIQDNFLTPSDFIPMGGTAFPKSTDETGDTALTGYINGLYANQATNQFVPGTSYLILRLNPDTGGDSGTKRYTVASADNITGMLPPTLTLVVVPEPGAIALLAGCGLLASALPRRRR